MQRQGCVLKKEPVDDYGHNRVLCSNIKFEVMDMNKGSKSSKTKSHHNTYFNSFLKNSDEVIICLSLDFKITEFNPTAECVFNWTRKQVLGKNFLQLCAQYALKSPISAKPTKVLAGEVVTNRTTILQNGKKKVLWKVICLRDIKEPIGFMLIGSSKEVKTLTCNKQGHFYLDYIIDHIPGSIYWKNCKGVLLGGNKYMANIAGGKSAKEFIGATDFEMPWHETAEYLRSIDKKVIKNGQEITTEETARLSDGHVHVFLTTKTPLRDEKGQIKGVLGVSMDITERKQLEAELKHARVEAEKDKKTLQIYLNNIIARIPGSVYWKDTHGTYLGCNNYVAKMAGVKNPSYIVGKTDFDMPWRDQAAYLRNADQEVIKTGIEKNLEELSLLADGTLATFLTSKVPLKDEESNIVGVLGVSVDISERKRLEQALMEAKEKAEIANQAKSRFLSSMAHDLRTPTNGLLGMADIVRDRVENSELDFYFDSIKKSGKTLIRLVDDILNFAKLESGKFEISSESFNFREIIQEVVTMITPQANQKKVQLIVDYPDSIPRHLISDPHCLRRILINLISNALKFTEHGYIWVSVIICEMDEKNAVLSLAVEDTGIGIPKDKLGLIFERFGRVEGSHESKYQGTGLGLTIVKEMVEKIGGTIKVESELGKGSTFICTLPFKLQDIAVRTSKWQRRYKDVRVLVVDENIRRGKVILSTLGIIEEPSIGKKAIDRLSLAQKDGKPYQIILINDDITSIDSFTLIKKIKESSDLSNILPLLLSNPVTLAESDAAKEAGFHALLIKPVQPTELINEMTRHWQSWLAKQSDIKTEIKNQAPLVLLIEDDLISRHFVKVILTDLGCIVDAVENGTQALASLDKDYDIIFSDLGLPDMTGLELAMKIRKQEANDSQAPIIALTGQMKGDFKARCLDAGMNDFVEKPINKESLLKILGKWVLGEGEQGETAATIGRWAEQQLT